MLQDTSRNIGATVDIPEGSTLADLQATWGDYYAWGETKPHYTANPYDASIVWVDGKEGYSWQTYDFCEDYNGTLFSKYSLGDGIQELEPTDDVARQDLKGLWRIPTDDEWYYLKEKTDWVWFDELKGWAVTAHGGTIGTDPTIFLPCAGLLYNRPSLIDGGVNGNYWTANRNADENEQNAWYYMIDEDGVGYDSDLRCLGFSVCAVTF